MYYTTCHFGGSWSAWWWSRTGAALLRSLHKIINEAHGGVIYVDDFLFLVPASRASRVCALIQVFLSAIGCPLSWHKVRSGPALEYIGFWVDAANARIGIPPEKFAKAVEFLNKLTKGDRVAVREIERGRGRLLWISWVATPLKPWLAPFFQCCASSGHQGSVRVGGQLSVAAALWKGFLNNFTALHHCRTPVDLGGSGAADAWASKDCAGLGGWYCPDGNFDWAKVKWFRLDLHMKDLPVWMQPQISANEQIAFLELLALGILAYLRLREESHRTCQIRLHHECDNLGSVGAVEKYFSTKAPMCFGLQALAWHAGRASANVKVSHIPGCKNELADRISRWRNFPRVIAQLPVSGEVTDFSLQDVLGPVWHFAALDG